MVSGGQTLVISQRDSHGELEMASERRMGSGLTPRWLEPGRTLQQHNKHPEPQERGWVAPQHGQCRGSGASQNTGVKVKATDCVERNLKDKPKIKTNTDRYIMMVQRN